MSIGTGMNCTDFEREWIDALAERRTGLSPGALAHLETCANCRRAWHGDRALDLPIAAWASSTLKPAPVSHRATPRQWPALGWSVAVAATGLLCVGLSLWSPSGSKPRLAGREAGSADLNLPLSDSVATLWDGVQIGSQQAAEETVRQLEHWPQAALDSARRQTDLPAAEAATTSTAESSRPWLGWGEPLGQQVGEAFRFLGQALPDLPDHPAG